MTPTLAGLATVFARIDALKARFEPAAPATSAFDAVLRQVSAADDASGSSGGATSAGTADLERLPKGERDLIVKEARRDGLDPALALAVVLQESGGNPRAVSPAGAMGLMQLMPGTARELGVTNPFDPAQNVAGGLEYLREKLAEFGSIPLALAAYNAGSGAVSAWGGVPPYAETQSYVSRILSARDQIAREMAAALTAGAAPSSAALRGAHDGTGMGVRTPQSAGMSAAGSGVSPRAAHPAALPSFGSVTSPGSAGTGPEHGDRSVHGMGGRLGSDAIVMPVTTGDGKGGAAGQDEVPSGGAPTGVAGTLDGRTAAAAASTRETAQHGVPGVPSVGADALARQGSQNPGGGEHNVGQGTGQTAPPSGGVLDAGTSTAGARALDASNQLPAPDRPVAGAAGGPVAHLTVRSGGDAPVTVTLTDRTDAVSGRVITPTPAMAQVLRDHVDGLRGALAAHHVHLSALAVRPATPDPSSRDQQRGDTRTLRPPQAFAMTTSEGEEQPNDHITA